MEKNGEREGTGISKIVKSIEDYYDELIGNDGFLGYCSNCDDFTYIINRKIWRAYDNKKEKKFLPVSKEVLRCFFCDTEERNLNFVSPADLFELYRLFGKGTPEKVVYLIDNWAEKNYFYENKDDFSKTEKNLENNLCLWNSMKQKEKYDESINFFIDQYKLKKNKNLEKLSSEKVHK